MGPYCKFCGQRCFTYLTDEWPEHVRRAYGHNTIAATCQAGQSFEKQRLGYCYADAIGGAGTRSGRPRA